MGHVYFIEVLHIRENTGCGNCGFRLGVRSPGGVVLGPADSSPYLIRYQQGGKSKTLVFRSFLDTLTPKSDQFQISPTASPEISHHIVLKNLAFHS